MAPNQASMILCQARRAENFGSLCAKPSLEPLLRRCEPIDHGRKLASGVARPAGAAPCNRAPRELHTNRGERADQADGRCPHAPEVLFRAPPDGQLRGLCRGTRPGASVPRQHEGADVSARGFLTRTDLSAESAPAGGSSVYLAESCDGASDTFGLVDLLGERVVEGTEHRGVVEHWGVALVSLECSGERTHDIVIVGLFAWRRDHPQQVVVAAAGGADVHSLVGGLLVDEDHGLVDGDALSGVGGAGVGELDVGGHVVGVEPGGAVLAGDGDAAAGVDPVDRPAVAVGDEFAAIGALPQVQAGGDVVASTSGVPVGEDHGTGGIDEPGVAEPGLDVAGHRPGRLVRGARDEKLLTGQPLAGSVLGRIGQRAGAQPAVEPVVVEDGPVTETQPQAGVLFPLGGEPVHGGQLDEMTITVVANQPGEHAASTDRAELGPVAHQGGAMPALFADVEESR